MANGGSPHGHEHEKPKKATAPKKVKATVKPKSGGSVATKKKSST